MTRLDTLRAADMVHVAVAEDDVFDVPEIDADLLDVLDQSSTKGSCAESNRM